MRVRHLTATGDDVPGWVPFGISPTSIHGYNHGARLAPDGVGGVYVGWLESSCLAHCTGDGGRVYAQHLTYAGTRAAGWPAEGIPAATQSAGAYVAPTVVPDGLGGVLIAWQRAIWTGGSQVLNFVRVQRFSATGAQPWPGSADAIAVAPASTGTQEDPALVGDGMGGALIAWTDERPGADAPQIYLQHVDVSGALRDSMGVALTASAYNQRLPRMIEDGTGGAFLVWQDSTAGAGLDLRAQRVDAQGSAQWGAGVAVTSGLPGDQREPTLCSDGAGGVFLAWIDRGAGGLVMATRLDGAGRAVPPWPMSGACINDGATGLRRPRLAPDGAGGVYVSWARVVEAATHIYADGSRAAGWPIAGMPLCTNGPDTCRWVDSTAPLYLVADNIGGAVAVWHEWRVYAYGADYERSYAQRLGVDGPTPTTLASLLYADASDGTVRIEWQVSGSGALDVERAVGSAAAGWSLLARVAPDGNDRVKVEDPDVRPGERYGYRLVRGEGAHAESLGETWLTVPLAEGLRIASARPNPAPGELRLAFALPDASAASLEVLDAAGRLVVVRRLEGLGAGAHELRLDESAGLPSGVYLIRLSQGSRFATTRACLLH